MAALVKFAATHGVLTVRTVWRMNPSIEGAVRREAQARPPFALRRLSVAGSKAPTGVCRRWDIKVPRATQS
jgi:hypothetical protein